MTRLDFAVYAVFAVVVITVFIASGAVDSLPWSRIRELTIF